MFDNNEGDIEKILNKAEADKVDEIAREYGRGEPSAVALVDKLLTEAGVKIEDLVVEELPLTKLERIDRLITIAETRRNASLREIDRRRAGD